jgi:hypothetical protein
MRPLKFNRDLKRVLVIHRRAPHVAPQVPARLRLFPHELREVAQRGDGAHWRHLRGSSDASKQMDVP